MSIFLYNALLQNVNLSSETATGRKLFIRAGIDMTMILNLSDHTLNCLNSGDAGRHNGIEHTDTYLEDNGLLYYIGNDRPTTYTNIWYFANESPFTGINRITNVSLLNTDELLNEFGREVSIFSNLDATSGSDCNIYWDAENIVVEDNAGSSAVYELSIEFV